MCYIYIHVHNVQYYSTTNADHRTSVPLDLLSVLYLCMVYMYNVCMLVTCTCTTDVPCCLCRFVHSGCGLAGSGPALHSGGAAADLHRAAAAQREAGHQPHDLDGLGAGGTGWSSPAAHLPSTLPTHAGSQGDNKDDVL